MWRQSQICNFQTLIKGRYMDHFLWNCPRVYVTGPLWCLVNIGSGNALVPSGNNPLPELMLLRSMSSYFVNASHRVKNWWNATSKAHIPYYETKCITKPREHAYVLALPHCVVISLTLLNSIINPKIWKACQCKQGRSCKCSRSSVGTCSEDQDYLLYTGLTLDICKK